MRRVARLVRWRFTTLGTDPVRLNSRMIRTLSSARFFEPNRPAMAVSTSRNGNIAISVESAIWLAIAQPSSLRKR